MRIWTIFAAAAAATAVASAPLSARTFANLNLKLVYLANFGNGSLDSSVNQIGIGPLKTGYSADINDTHPTWTPQNGTFLIGITRPATLTSGIVGAGLFATPVDFDKGSFFGLRATFIKPIGPHLTGNVWAVTLSIRTGDEDDLGAETRAAASLQIRGRGVRLNVVGASPPPNPPNLPQDVFDAIFNSDDPQPFALELLVDRITGAGEATLKVGDSTFSQTAQFAAFKADSGPAITAVGPTIAISNGPSQSASVQVRDFQIYSPKSEDGSDTASAECSPGWAAFNCRAVPTSH